MDGLTSVWTVGNQGKADIKADDGDQLHRMLDGKKDFDKRRCM